MYKCLGLLFILLSCFNCSDDNTIVEEKPFTSFLKLDSIQIDTITMANNVWEYGFRFSPTSNGVITKLGIKVPVINTFKVKLYNIASNQILAQTTITTSSSDGEFFGDIADIPVNSGDDLGLAIVADVFFKVKNLSGEAFMFPVTRDNISIKSFNEEICGVNGCNAFPSNTNNFVIAPCVNLVFVKD